MRARPLGEVTELMGGRLSRTDTAALPVAGASIDTRTLAPGELFFALSGQHADGREFTGEAFDRGAVAAVLREPVARAAPQVLVDDPARALGQLARAVREQESTELPAAVITGSVGKTTTCRYAAELLVAVGECHRPPSSFNNELGVPLTILGAPDDSKYLLVEVGSNKPGEVLPLARWAHPRVACVTAIAPVHLEGLGDMTGVAREKLSVLDALPADGEGWVPVEAAQHWSRHLCGVARVRSFGPGGDLEISPCKRPGQFMLRFGREEPAMTFEWDPPFPHSLSSLEAALAVAAGLGVPPEALLDHIPRLTLPPLRGECRAHAGVELLLDCYNSSPVALRSALSRLSSEPAEGRRICVLGTMEELGPEEERWHREVGEHLADVDIDDVLLVGRAAPWFLEGLERRGGRGRIIGTDESAAEELASRLGPGDRVLMKASRAQALEEFAERVARQLDARVAEGV